MARSGETFAKRQREKARQEKQAAKRARRLEKDEADSTEEAPDLDALMEEFRIINEAHAAGELDAEEFEERRDDILMKLGVE
ncbi:MAG TPA: SHOCT domain-containing protein [Acidimicrobiales bacterium]|nr:SHOCT domain-containing protein [Acidimicrobiales bacterium]